ncbi:hypothetical protein BDV28DRAFT_158937 [Aspergillus coremiiformis]|uniref:Uncharacterized protein n=1 Tax=Aspergillus coremiiformis TaxID=138285 RepID=A0A5N6Z0N0_9EURO|nr:hypothetical protein BDV28DRAFT_158937 [Aspergillus coremiiformis]
MVPRFREPRRRQSNSSNDEPGSPSDMGNQNSASDDGHEPSSSAPFYPGIYDVLKVRYLLRWKIIREGLPVEIVDLIVDEAEYWPSIEAALNEKRIIHQDGDQVLARTAPLCYDPKTLGSDSPRVLPHRTRHPCRKIVFSIASHDQGFAGSGHGTFHGSYTWFDAEVVPSAHLLASADAGSIPEPDANGIRFGQGHPLLLPSSHKLQSNRTAVRGTQHYEITWHHLDNLDARSVEAEEIQENQGRGRATLDGSQVRAMQVGDVVSVWGRARFGAWSNHVEQLSVRVFWAV